MDQLLSLQIIAALIIIICSYYVTFKVEINVDYLITVYSEKKNARKENTDFNHRSIPQKTEIVIRLKIKFSFSLC